MKNKTTYISSWLWTTLLAILLVIALRVIFVSTKESSEPQKIKQAATTLPILGKIPHFKLKNQENQTVTAKDLEGTPWVANFMFTRCSGPCPLMSSHMKRLQKQSEGQLDIKYVSFSVDPEYDKPKVLAKYGAKYDANANQWAFLTGSKEAIFKLSSQHFYLGVGDVPEEDRESVDQAVFHSTKFVLVDANLKIRGYYDSENRSQLGKILLDAETLL